MKELKAGDKVRHKVDGRIGKIVEDLFGGVYHVDWEGLPNSTVKESFLEKIG